VRRNFLLRGAVSACALILATAPSAAVQAAGGTMIHVPTLAFNQAAPPPREPAPRVRSAPPPRAVEPSRVEPRREETGARAERTGPSVESEHLHQGVSAFFNVRDAYSNVSAREWEFEFTARWMTWQDHRRDEVELSQALYYGITDDLHVELEVEEPLGYGGEGVGELYLTIFNTFWHEGDVLPAFALSLTGRFPSGYESSGVDGKLTGMLTKTLFPRFRMHFQGWIMTANGAPGYEEDAERRDFQWGVGPGFDYEIRPGTLAVLNYINRSSDEYGRHNNNILELGLVQDLPDLGSATQELKLAADVGLDGLGSTQHLGAKVLWEIHWK
jgi:hypothetical protein